MFTVVVEQTTPSELLFVQQLAIATMYVRNQSFKQQCSYSFEMCNTHTGVLLREWTHTTQCSLFMRKSAKQSMRVCLVVVCSTYMYSYYYRRTPTLIVDMSGMFILFNLIAIVGPLNADS